MSNFLGDALVQLYDCRDDGGREMRVLREQDGRQWVLNFRTLQWEDGAEIGAVFALTDDQRLRVPA